MRVDANSRSATALVQVGITGLDPAVEPSPARLRDVVEVGGRGP